MHSRKAARTPAVGPAQVDASATSQQKASYLLANFIWSSALSISAPFCFMLRGNCKNGLLRHLGVSPKMYGALLLSLGWID